MKKRRSVGDGIQDGPIEQGDWPEVLTARVVAPGDEPRIHGYDVQADLARHYGWLEVALLALTGELVDASCVQAAEVALGFLAPASVGQAPVHAGMVARLAGAADSSITAAAALTLAEQAGAMVERHARLLAWLEDRAGEPPADSLAGSAPDRRAARRLDGALRARGVRLPALEADLGLEAGILAALHHAGLRSPAAIGLAVTLAGLPCAVAEAQAVRPGDFAGYPMRLPDFVYEEDAE